MRRSLVIGALVRPEVSIVSPTLFYFILFFCFLPVVQGSRPRGLSVRSVLGWCWCSCVDGGEGRDDGR